MPLTASATHATGSPAAAHFVTSLPPIETVMSATRLRCDRMKRAAAAAWVRSS